MSNSSEEFSYPTINSNFKILHVYQFINFFSYLAYTQTDRLTDGHTDRMTYRDECSILALNRKYRGDRGTVATGHSESVAI